MRIWLCLILLAACSSGPSTGADGGGGGGDGPPPSGTPVTALVDNGGAPVANARVVFQNADSSVVADTVTDAGGSASASMEAGGFVTVVSPSNIGDTLQTIAAVAPGDALVFHRVDRSVAPTFSLTVPSNPGTTIYSVDMTCHGIAVIDVGSAGHDTQGSDSVTGTGQVENCPSGVVDMLITPTDTNLALLARDVPINAGPVVITGAYAPNVSVTVDATNVPAGYPDLGFEYKVQTPRGTLLDSYELDGSAMVVAGAESGTLTVPAGDYGFVDRQAFDTGSTLDELDAIGWGSSHAATLARDLSGAALPGFASVPQFDAATHALTWQATAGTATPTIALSWVEGERNGTTWQWLITEPYTAGAVTYPVLPVGSFDYNFAATDTAANAYTALLSIPAGTEAGVRAGMFASESDDDIFDAIRVGDSGQIFIMQCDHGGQCK
jgi:hypothetical protein